MTNPGYDGRLELGIKSVVDPLEPEAVLSVAVNVRHDVIEYLYSRIDPNTKRRAINEAQRQAGNAFLALLERTEEARGLAIDYAKVRVDGGQGVQEFSLDREKAARTLARIRRAVGDRDYFLLRRVIVHRIAIARIAETSAEKRYLSRRFRDALTALAIYFRLESPPKSWHIPKAA